MNQRSFVLLLCALLFVVGCGGEKKPEGMPALNKTTLTFVQDGTPLAGATVTLVPLDKDNMKWPAGGTTDASGVLHVKTMMKFDGVPAGKYKITVTKTESEGTPDSTESSDEVGAKPAAASSPKMFYLVDSKFRSANNTTLEIEINSGNNTETFDLGKAIREQIVFRAD